MATDINTIYSWFEQGDFPTATQFQATFSSFYHKSETIPMGKIESLDKVFGKYVLSETFNSHLKDEKAHAKHLVKLDASNISEKNRKALRESLGVGDLPPNLATIDYVDQKSKNVANSPLMTTENAGIRLTSQWYIDAQSHPLQFRSLQNAEGDDLFDKKVVIKQDGTLGAKPDEVELQLTIPDTLRIDPAPPVNVSYTVNHIYPEPVPEIGEEFNNLKNFMATIDQQQLTPITDFTITTIDGDTTRAKVENGVISFKQQTTGITLTPQVSVLSNIILPSNKDWILMLRMDRVIHFNGWKGGNIGFVRGGINNSQVQSSEFATITGGEIYLGLSGVIRTGERYRYLKYTPSYIIYTRVGRILNVSATFADGFSLSENIDAQTFLGDYRFMVGMGAGNGPYDIPVFNNIRYYVKP